MMSALSRTDSLFVAPAPRAVGEPNMSLAYDHRQKHPGSLYTDENHTHFNTPNGVVDVPRPLLLGSNEWKIAQFAQKKTESESNGELLTSAQIKRIKQGIAKAAKSYNDQQHAAQKLAEETAHAELLRKQRRKDAKKKRMQDAKQNKLAIKLRELTQEADTLFSQCEKLHITPTLSSDETDESVIQKCQHAITLYMTRPLTEAEIIARDFGATKQKQSISACARSQEVFLDGKTNLVTANQMVAGDEIQLPKKKKNKKKQDTKNTPPPNVPDTPDVKIDWDQDLKMGEKLTKKQRRQIAAANKVADGA